MNTSARNILSTLSGLALVAFVAISSVTAGTASASTVLGISGLVAWALVQMIMLEFSVGSTANQPALRTEAQAVRTPTVIAFPRPVRAPRQAA